MARVLVVCEGPDDLVVFREYLLRLRPSKPLLVKLPTRVTLEFRGEVGGADTLPPTVVLLNAGSKSKLAITLSEHVRPNAGPPFDSIVVSFDPDRDTPAQEFEFFPKDWAKLNDSFKLQRVDSGWSVALGNATLPLHPLPWRTVGSPGFDGLADESNLERVLIEGIVASGLSDPTQWVEQATGSLVALDPDHGWKRALRLWNAALYPKTAEDSFVAHLIQNEQTRAGCLAALDSAGLRQLFIRLLSFPD